MRRIIYAWNYVEWGGAQVYTLALIKEARRKFEILVILPKGTDTQFLGLLEAQNIEFAEFEPAVDLSPTSGVVSKLARRWRRLRSEHKMIKTIRRIGLDDAVVHTDLLPAHSFLSLARLCRHTNVFTTGHNALPSVSAIRWYLMRLKFLLISRFSTFHVFCANQNAAKYFRRLYVGRVANEIKVTYASIDPDEIAHARASDFDRAEILRRCGVESDKFIVLAVGQFIDRKGRWIFLDAARRITSACDDIDFIWLTPSDVAEADRSRIGDYDLRGRFHLVRAGAIGESREDVLRFFRIGDIYALPSFIEGLPISLLEAMAIGLTAISSNVYGIPEAIIHEKTGLLIEPGDSDSLVAAILRLRNDPDLRRRLSKAGREHVVRSFDEREAARIAISEYERVFNSRQ